MTIDSQPLSLAEAGVQLQTSRVIEATDGVELAKLQRRRAEIQANHYAGLLEDTKSNAAALENRALFNYARIKDIQNALYAIVASRNLPEGSSQFDINFADIVKAYYRSDNLAVVSALAGSAVAFYTTLATQSSLAASFERRKEEWQFQQSLAQQDLLIGSQQITLAYDSVEVRKQEKVIAELTAGNDKDTVEFLTTKFTNVDLYDWMSNVLERVFSYFLQQATAMAKLAEDQLAFERQGVPSAFIRSDYWELPSDGGTFGITDGQAADRRGLTGSTRLLQDIYQLDQYAFHSKKRKLPLTKTISLAQLGPAEFQRFTETGVLIFSTPMEMFDRDFPGHYLRIISRVRTSIIALIPPTDGIHATLSISGLSRVVIGSDVFQTVPIRRDPELVALGTPINATGILEMEARQSDMLFPFEGCGVDTTWELRLPKAANQFDYRTIADVLVTIEFTALDSFDYRQQVIQTLKPGMSADLALSFRHHLADQWYDLHNPEQTKTPMTVKFSTGPEDFPPNLDALKIQQVLMYFSRADGKSFEVPVSQLRFTERGSGGPVGGAATSIDGAISTRRANGSTWASSFTGKPPMGEWELVLPNTEEMRKRFGAAGGDEDIADILFVITYSGRTPEWPA